jgi:replication factor C large subunit
MDWAEKYRPIRLQDIIGNPASIHQMAAWARSWTPRSKPLLLYGKPGIGKTSSAHALARDMGWDVIELNASDQRTAAVIDRIVGGGSTTASLTGSQRKLVVIDEADNLHGTADRGGARAIIECIKHAQQPVILIANDLYDLAPELRLRCEPVQFRAIPARSIAPRLKYICAAEKIECTDAAVRQIAESAEGDVRSAVNMLYGSAIGRQHLDDAQVHASQKDERISIFALISSLAARTTDEDLIRLSWEVEDAPESIEQWIESNIHLFVDPDRMGIAYRHLARADEYLGFTYRRQYHTLWRYANAMMLLGVADAAAGKGIHAKIMPPSRWQKMSGAKKAKAIRTILLNKVSGMMQIPQITLREEYLRTFSLLVEHDPEAFCRELYLDAESLNFFLHDMAKSKEVVKRVEQEILKEEKEKEQQAKAQAKTPAGTRIPKDVPAPEVTPEKKLQSNNQSSLFDGF